jgi:hypothetical protein
MCFLSPGSFVRAYGQTKATSSFHTKNIPVGGQRLKQCIEKLVQQIGFIKIETYGISSKAIQALIPGDDAVAGQKPKSSTCL